MNRHLRYWLALAAVAVWGETTRAQFSQPVRPGIVSPPYSPYLNLTRRGNPAINYYGLVRPEVEARAAVRNLQGQVTQIRQQEATEQAATGVLPVTGYTVRFLDYGGYFRGVGSGQSATRPAAPVTTAAATTRRPGPIRPAPR